MHRRGEHQHVYATISDRKSYKRLQSKLQKTPEARSTPPRPTSKTRQVKAPGHAARRILSPGLSPVVEGKISTPYLVVLQQREPMPGQKRNLPRKSWTRRHRRRQSSAGELDARRVTHKLQAWSWGGTLRSLERSTTRSSVERHRLVLANSPVFLLKYCTVALVSRGVYVGSLRTLAQAALSDIFVAVTENCSIFSKREHRHFPRNLGALQNPKPQCMYTWRHTNLLSSEETSTAGIDGP